MNPNTLFIQEARDERGDVMWSYWTRGGLTGLSYDYRMPLHVAELHELTVRYLV